MSATSKTGRAALVAANGRASRPAEPPQGDFSHAEAQRDRERRDMFWFGNAPEGWSVGKMRSVVYERREKFSRNEELIILSLLKDVGVIPYSEKGEIGNKSKEDHSQYKVARKGDLVINSMNVIIGSVGISPYDGYISPAYYSFVPREDTCMGYIGYLCSTRRFQRAVRCYAKGIMEIRLRVSSYDFLSMPIPLPPLPEQKAIVAYLDAETGRLDKAIAAEEKMIALLQERREIVINEAVAPHDGWEVRRLGTIGEFSKGGGISRDDLQESGLPAILYGDIYTKYNHAVVEVKNHISDRTAKGAVSVEYGDILMTGSGETKEDIGKAVAFLGDSSFIGGDVICFRQKDHNSCYLSYALNSEAAKAFRYRESKGEIVVHIYASSLKQLPIPLPPLPEQEAIVERLDRETGKIDRAIEVKRRQIELLRERRQIVIDEVVTGKVKVA